MVHLHKSYSRNQNLNENRRLSVSLTACFVEASLTHTLHTFTHVETEAQFIAKHTILGGKVHVYRRENRKFWQCSRGPDATLTVEHCGSGGG